MATVVEVEPRSRESIRQHVEEVLKAFQPQALQRAEAIDVEQLFDLHLEELAGVTSSYESDLEPGVFGYTNPTDRRCVVLAGLAESEDEVDHRFFRSTVAHEIGHCMLHVTELQRRQLAQALIHDASHSEIRLHRRNTKDLPAYRNPEWQAWEYAGALLMPKKKLAEAYEKENDIREIAKTFDVNPKFVRVRLKKLELM